MRVFLLLYFICGPCLFTLVLATKCANPKAKGCIKPEDMYLLRGKYATLSLSCSNRRLMNIRGGFQDQQKPEDYSKGQIKDFNQSFLGSNGFNSDDTPNSSNQVRGFFLRLSGFIKSLTLVMIAGFLVRNSLMGNGSNFLHLLASNMQSIFLKIKKWFSISKVGRMVEYAEIGFCLFFLVHWIYRRKGTVKYRNGRYSGSILFGRPHGTGTLILSNGTKYCGRFSKGKPHGYGCFVFENGNVYEGHIKFGLPDGTGNFIQRDQTTYSGGFKEGKMHGVGKIRFSSGAEYIGGMRNGTQCGWGAMLFVNQDCYEGEFSKGQPNGYGTLMTHGGSFYEGQFVSGAFHGFGILRPSFESLQTVASAMEGGIGRQEPRYEGQFERGQPHGQGVLYLPTGSRLEGTFRDGKPFGIVAVQTPDGDIMDVEFDEDGKPIE